MTLEQIETLILLLEELHSSIEGCYSSHINSHPLWRYNFKHISDKKSQNNRVLEQLEQLRKIRDEMKKS